MLKTLKDILNDRIIMFGEPEKLLVKTIEEQDETIKLKEEKLIKLVFNIIDKQERIHKHTKVEYQTKLPERKGY